MGTNSSNSLFLHQPTQLTRYHHTHTMAEHKNFMYDGPAYEKRDPIDMKKIMADARKEYTVRTKSAGRPSPWGRSKSPRFAPTNASSPFSQKVKATPGPGHTNPRGYTSFTALKSPTVKKGKAAGFGSEKPRFPHQQFSKGFLQPDMGGGGPVLTAVEN